MTVTSAILIAMLGTAAGGEPLSAGRAEHSCVPAAAAVAMRYLRVPVTYSELLDEIPVDPDKGGASIADLARACERRGLRWRATTVTNLQELRGLMAPDRALVAVPQGTDRVHALCLFDAPEGIVAADLVGGVWVANPNELDEQFAKGLVCVTIERQRAEGVGYYLPLAIAASLAVALVATVVSFRKNTPTREVST
jgi:hypothetical protein